MFSYSDDAFFMNNALAMGRRHKGLTYPNPSVGAVIVSPDKIILGRGVTHHGGRPHAERVAFAEAGFAAKGATLYVTLEPCSHHGKSPPCVEAIMEAGITRVVSALTDPDPRVAGRGHAALEQAGIAVTVGVLGDQALKDHQGHITRILINRPFLTLKLAQTRDGYAGIAGQRLLITGEEARTRTHMMRMRHDAILVGIGTVLADNPHLNVRLPGLEDRSPHRVVLDSTLKLPLTSHLVQTASKIPLWVITTFNASPEREKELALRGVKVLRTQSDDHGRVTITDALRLLADEGITRLFCEGGPMLADALADTVDDIITITSPHNVAEASSAIPAMSQRLKTMMSTDFIIRDQEQAGDDVIIYTSRKTSA
jgi:diaminohydroxyphosphoribosylaminopyrimidine deaminase / 5-amino-6-(5-phosphoribosylamino)uracil reductase